MTALCHFLAIIVPFQVSDLLCVFRWQTVVGNNTPKHGALRLY